MKSRTREGRLLAVLDYEGAPAEDDPHVSHVETLQGVALCGADAGDHADGLDCPSCASLVAGESPELEDALGCELADGCVDPGSCVIAGECGVRAGTL